MERKYPLTIDRSAETGGDTREGAFNKVDKELDNIIGSAKSIKEELGALAAEVEAIEPVDTSSFAKKTEIPKIASGSGIRVVVTGQEHKISTDIPVASGSVTGLMSSVDKTALDGLKAQEPIFEGHLTDPDKHLPEIATGDAGKVLEATVTGAKWVESASVEAVSSLNGKSGNLTLSGTGAATITSVGNALTVNVPASPVTSVNGKTGAVVIDTIGVTSFNGKTGALSMSGTGIASVSTGTGYITVNVPAPNYPVKSVNGKYGDVVLGAADVGAAATNHTHVFPVTSVNGQTGAVVIETGGGSGGADNQWQVNQSYSYGDIVTATSRDNFKKFFCVKEGLSGVSNPLLSIDIAFGNYVDDGTLKWLAFDCTDGTPVGVPVLRNSVPNGYLRTDRVTPIDLSLHPRLMQIIYDDPTQVTTSIFNDTFWYRQSGTLYLSPHLKGFEMALDVSSAQRPTQDNFATNYYVNRANITQDTWSSLDIVSFGAFSEAVQFKMDTPVEVDLTGRQQYVNKLYSVIRF